MVHCPCTRGYGTALKFSNLEVANVSESETVQKWLGYAEVVEVCGSIYGIWWAPETKFGEKWMENGAVDRDVAARGRMSRWKAGCPEAGCPGLTGRMSGLWIRGRTG